MKANLGILGIAATILAAPAGALHVVFDPDDVSLCPATVSDCPEIDLPQVLYLPLAEAVEPVVGQIPDSMNRRLACALESPSGEASYPCGDAGMDCVPEDEEDVHRCWVYCWQWEDDPENDGWEGCGSDFVNEYTYNAVGIYYCPPSGTHQGCDAHGAPTQGSITADGFPTYCQGDDCGVNLDVKSWSWRLTFDNGIATNPDNQPDYFRTVARAVQAYPPASGTFGGLFEFRFSEP